MPLDSPKRLAVFGATGQLGQQLIEKLAETDWPISELLGVASANSAGAEFEFRGESLDVASEWPTLKGRDLVFVCTPQVEALEIVREALRAEVPCLDCSGALATQADVPVPMPTLLASSATSDRSAASPESAARDDEAIAGAPLLSIPSGTMLSFAPIFEALEVSRALGTVFSSASALGQKGVLALSEESIALFNQSESAEPGPAGQPVAFDVIPGGGIDCERVRAECRRLFGEAPLLDLAGVQVPTFVGQGAWLSLELAGPLRLEDLEARLSEIEGLSVMGDGYGSRGIAAVDEERAAPIGPTLRDAMGSDEILVGRIESDPSLPTGLGWRLWLACDPLRLAADQALRLAGRRLGLT